MIKRTLFKSGIFILGLLTGIVHLNAQTTYYFTGATDNDYRTASNWNTERNGSGTAPETTVLQSTPENVTLIVPTGKTASTNLSSAFSMYGHLIIESGGIIDFTYYTPYIYGKLTVNSGGTLNSTNGVKVYANSTVEVAGTINIPGTSSSSSITASATPALVEVKPGGVVIGSINGPKLINNGTVQSTVVTASVIEGTGILSSRTTITATNFAESSFFQANGGTAIYLNSNKNAVTLLPTYNFLEINSFETADKQYNGTSTVYSNLRLSGNVKQVTLAGTIDVKGNLTVENSKVITTEVIQVAGNVSTTGLAEGSVLNVTLTGTAQNIEGTGITNLVVPVGTTVTLTGDLTVTNLAQYGTINENGYTLTVINQVGSLITQLRGILDNIAGNYTETYYTSASWTALQAAIAEVQPLLADEADPTSTQLDNAIATVTAAIEALVTNLSVLESYVSTIKANYGNPTVYTEATYNALFTAITAAETFLENKAAITPTELAAYKGDIDTAIAALVREVYTFYLITGGNAVSPLSYDKWNTARDGSGIQAVAFAPENVGHTYIIPAELGVNSGSGAPTFYGSRLVLEAGTARVGLMGISLHGSTLTVGDGRTLSSSVSTYGDNDTLRVEAGATVSSAFSGNGGEVIVDAGGTLSASFAGAYTLEANGEVTLNGGQLSRITGTGTIIGAGSVTLADAAGSTFLQSGGGTLIYRTAATLLPSYNHLTIEEITTAATLSREVTTDTVPVYGNLLLSNNHRRVEFSNPLAVAGDFTVDYDIEDEAVVRATLTVAGNVSLSGLLPEDHALNVTLAGTEEQELSGAGFTNLTLPDGTSAVLTGNLSIEAALTLNGVLDRNGRTLSFGSRSGNGILTDGLLAAALQGSIDQAKADYPDGSIYTTASWQALQTAIDAGKALLAGETPAEVAALEVAIAAIAAAIEGLESATGLVPPSGDTWRIHAGASTLSVTGNVDLRVVTLAGREAYHGRVTGEKTLRLPAGVYIVTVNGRSGKVVVR